MADIFVSYAREDIERAARIGEFLAARGFSVWWDRELTAGDRFATVVQDALAQAKAVVVLWSKNSVILTGYMQRHRKLSNGIS